MSANEIQVAGTHYKDKAIQPWDYIVSNNMGYLEGNIVKYVSRWKDKGGVADLKKAQHYLQKLIEVSEAPATMADVAEVVETARRHEHECIRYNQASTTK